MGGGFLERQSPRPPRAAIGGLTGRRFGFTSTGMEGHTVRKGRGQAAHEGAASFMDFIDAVCAEGRAHGIEVEVGRITGSHVELRIESRIRNETARSWLVIPRVQDRFTLQEYKEYWHKQLKPHLFYTSAGAKITEWPFIDAFLARIKPAHYTGEDASPSRPDDASREGMGKDFNTKIKQARTEVLASMLDLDNPALSDGERLTRARRLQRSFERRRAEEPDYPASPEVQKAIGIINRHNYRNAKARKAKAAKVAM